MPNASLTTVLTGMNTIGLFASRAFVSAFAIAAVLRWGPQIDWVNNTGLLQRITDVPTWFTHDVTLVILGLLAALEIAATKSADARALLNEIDGHLKTGMSFLTTLVVAGVITSNDAAVIQEVIGWVEPVRAGFGENLLSFVTASLAATGVWFTCRARSQMLGVLFEADPDDDTMVAGVLSWAEDLWALLGTLLLILFPLVMLGITAALLGTVALLRWRAKRREEQSKTSCANCNEQMYRCAVACPKCNTANPSIHAVGWLGQTRSRPASSPADQPVVLTQKQRCPVCATHLKPRRARQACTACGHELFKDSDAAQRYLAALDARLPLTLTVTAVFSLIPLVGLIPALITYRLRLIAPLRRYTSMVRTVPTRWLLRLLLIVMVWLQVVPGIGALAVPVVALVSYGAYRRMFTGQLERERASDTPADPAEPACTEP